MKRKMKKVKVKDMTKGKPFAAGPKKPGADNAPFMKSHAGGAHKARTKKLSGVML